MPEDEDEAEDNLSRPRPRTTFRPRGQSGLEDLTSLITDQMRGTDTRTDVYVCSLFIQPLKALHDFTNKLPQFVDSMYPHIEPYAWPAASISQTWTIWILLLVTVDRYIAVCLPLSRHLRSVRRTKLATGATLALAVLYNVPLFLERDVKRAHQ